MSGVWERLVQITKKHIKSAAGDGLLSDFELRTLLAEALITVLCFLCIALLFSSFYGVVFEVFSSLTAAMARLF